MSFQLVPRLSLICTAPPGYIYSSSNPTPNLSPYQRYDLHAYADQHATASPTGWKPQYYHGALELLGETVWRGELESPVPCPKARSPPQDPEAAGLGAETAMEGGTPLR
jgi:hypothetical protein